MHLHWLLALLAVVVSSAVATGETNVLPTHIGVAEIGPEGEGCLTIRNPAIAEQSEITLVLVQKPQSIIKAQIKGKAERSCSTDIDAPGDATFYIFRARGNTPDGRTIAIAVTEPDPDTYVQAGLVRIDLNRDKSFESFRACSSHEGLHLTIWTDDPLQSRRLWHEYFYLGYDVEPDCTVQDYE